ATLIWINFRANMVHGLQPEPYHRTVLLPITSPAMRSRRQSMRKAFSFGAFAPRRVRGTDWRFTCSNLTPPWKMYSSSCQVEAKPCWRQKMGRVQRACRATPFFLPRGAGFAALCLLSEPTYANDSRSDRFRTLFRKVKLD